MTDERFSQAALQKHINTALKDVPHTHHKVKFTYDVGNGNLEVGYAARFENNWIVSGQFTAHLKDKKSYGGKIEVEKSW